MTDRRQSIFDHGVYLPPECVRLAYDFGWHVYELAWANIDSLDQKAVGLAGFVGVITGLSLLSLPPRPVGTFVLAFYIGGSAAMLMATCFAIRAVRIRKVPLPGTPGGVAKYMQSPLLPARDRERLTAQMVADKLHSQAIKLAVVSDAKAKSLRLAYWLLFAGLLLLVVHRVLLSCVPPPTWVCQGSGPAWGPGWLH